MKYRSGTLVVGASLPACSSPSPSAVPDAARPLADAGRERADRLDFRLDACISRACILPGAVIPWWSGPAGGARRALAKGLPRRAPPPAPAPVTVWYILADAGRGAPCEDDDEVVAVAAWRIVSIRSSRLPADGSERAPQTRPPNAAALEKLILKI